MVFCILLSTTDFFLSFLASSMIFLAPLFESTFERLLLEQYFSFRDLVIKPQELLQVPSLLNDNSLLKTFFQSFVPIFFVAHYNIRDS